MTLILVSELDQVKYLKRFARMLSPETERGNSCKQTGWRRPPPYLKESLSGPQYLSLCDVGFLCVLCGRSRRSPRFGFRRELGRHKPRIAEVAENSRRVRGDEQNFFRALA